MYVHIHTEPHREDFLGKGGLDHLQERGKENSRDYSHGEGRTGKFSRV